MLIFRAAKVRFSFLNQQKSYAILSYKTLAAFSKKLSMPQKTSQMVNETVVTTLKSMR